MTDLTCQAARCSCITKTNKQTKKLEDRLVTNSTVNHLSGKTRMTISLEDFSLGVAVPKGRAYIIIMVDFVNTHFGKLGVMCFMFYHLQRWLY